MRYHYKANVFRAKWSEDIISTDYLNDGTVGDATTSVSVNEAPLSLTLFYDNGNVGLLKFCYFKFSFLVKTTFEWILEGSNDLEFWQVINKSVTVSAGTHNTPVTLTDQNYSFRYFRLSLRGDEVPTSVGSVSDWRLSVLSDEYPIYEYKQGFQQSLGSATQTSYLNDLVNNDQTTYITSGASGMTAFCTLGSDQVLNNATFTVYTTGSASGLEWSIYGSPSDNESWTSIGTGTISGTGWATGSVSGGTWGVLRFSGRQTGSGSADFKLSDFRIDSELQINQLAKMSNWLGTLSSNQISSSSTSTQNSQTQFNYVSPKLDPACSVTWEALDDDLWLYPVQDDEEVVGVRDFTHISFGKTENIDHLTNNKLYYYETYSSPSYPSGTLSLVVWSSTNPSGSILVDFVRDTTFPEIRELLYVQDGKVSFSYLPAVDVTISRGSSSVTANSVTGDVNISIADEYEWVKAVYKVDRSFTILKDDEIYCWQSTPSFLQLKWEKGSPKNTRITRVNGEPIDFNLLNPHSYQAGYICLSQTNPTIATATNISIEADRLGYVPEWEEQVFLNIIVTDKNGLGIPQKDITITSNTPVSSMVEAGLIKTNNTGRVLLYVTPTGNTLSVTATVDSLSKVFTLNKFDNGLTLDNRANGFVALVVSKKKTALGGVLSRVSSHFLDGIPKDNTDININSSLGSSFKYLNTTGQIVESVRTLQITSKVTPTETLGVSPDITIQPVTKDQIYAVTDSGQSKILNVNNV